MATGLNIDSDALVVADSVFEFLDHNDALIGDYDNVNEAGDELGNEDGEDEDDADDEDEGMM